MERLEKELKMLRFANVNKIEDGHYSISRKQSVRLEEDVCYLVKLKDSMFNQDSLLVSNWNRGLIPKARYYQIEVQKIMGDTMIKVVGIGYNEDTCINIVDNFSGWFPISEIEVIRKL